MRSPSFLFAGLHQLLWPVLDRADDLPGVQGAALRGAFRLTAERVEDRFLVSVAVLGLLTTVAEDGPLLCVFDDAHWLDQPSADALQVRGPPAAGRPGCAVARVARRRRATVRGRGTPELRLAGLAAADAAALLDATTRLPETVRHQLMEVTHGNPLALLELPRGLTDDQRAGRTPLVGDVTLSAEIEQAFLAQIRPPEATQRLLLLAAADDSAEIGTVLGAAERLGPAAGALDAAERAGLLTEVASGCASGIRSCGPRSMGPQPRASGARPTRRSPPCSPASETPTATPGTARPRRSHPTRRPPPSWSARRAPRVRGVGTRRRHARSSAPQSSARLAAAAAAGRRRLRRARGSHASRLEPARSRRA